ncbi:hypothetical protein D3C71_1836790 [compost metagenome]
MVDQAEWERLQAIPGRLGDMSWKPLVIKELLDLTDEERAEFDALDEEEGEGEYDASFDLEQILQFVKDGKINVLGTAEGLQM